jgi:hypothetical protein
VQGGDHRDVQGVGLLDRVRVQGVVVDQVERAQQAVPDLRDQVGEALPFGPADIRMIGDVGALGPVAGGQAAEFVADHTRVAAGGPGHQHGVPAGPQPRGQRPGVRLEPAGERLRDRIPERGDDQDLET